MLRKVAFFLFFLPFISFAQEYIIQPGDILTISVLGQQSLSGTVVVDHSGHISLPSPVGMVKVIGKTVDEVTLFLEDYLKKYIKEPMVFVSVKPSEGFMIHIIGEVRSPSFYSISEGTSLQEVITMAGGLTDIADKKNIRLFRKEYDSDQKEIIKELRIDYSIFLEKYDLADNPILKPNDVILVPGLTIEEHAAQTVIILGSIRSPGVLPLSKPLSLIGILALAGGASADADLSRVSILNMSDGKYTWNYVSFKDFLSKGNQDANPMISPGMIVYIPSIEREEGIKFSVNVAGEVNNDGAYTVREGTRLFDVIFMAGGLSDVASIDKIMIINSSRNSRTIITANIRDFLETGNMEGNPVLNEGDTVFVPVIEGTKRVSSIQTPFLKSIRVSVMGQVNMPGSFLIASDSNLLDVLKLVGGTGLGADLKRVLIIRGGLVEEQRLKVNLNHILEEGDLRLLPQLYTDDTIFVPLAKPKLNIWGRIVGAASGISTVIIAYFLITGRRV
jgi:polysaccharide export outer membrane protein